MVLSLLAIPGTVAQSVFLFASPLINQFAAENKSSLLRVSPLFEPP
jgi:hypothetical protein